MAVPSRGCSAGDQIQDLVHITVCYIQHVCMGVTWVSTCSVIWRGGEKGRERERKSEFSFWTEVRKMIIAHTGLGARWAPHLQAPKRNRTT